MKGIEKNNLTPPEQAPQPSTPLWKRIAALAGVIFMILLTILFTYSIATGSIFAW